MSAGLLAEFADADALTRAARAARKAGYRRFDAFSPFPIAEVSQAVGYRPLVIPLVALAAALFGGALQYFAQYWLNAVDYPLNIGGRPLHSWPAFIPATVIVSILWAGAAGMLAMALLTRLPRLSHPLFDVPAFAKATDDGFFLCVFADDPKFDARGTMRFLRGLRPSAVHEVPS